MIRFSSVVMIRFSSVVMIRFSSIVSGLQSPPSSLVLLQRKRDRSDGEGASPMQGLTKMEQVL